MNSVLTVFWFKTMSFWSTPKTKKSVSRHVLWHCLSSPLRELGETISDATFQTFFLSLTHTKQDQKYSFAPIWCWTWHACHFFNLSWAHWSSVMTNKEHGLSNILKPAVAMYWEATLKGQNQWARWRLDHQPWWSYQLKTLAIPKPPLNTNLRAAMKEGRKKKNRSKWEGKREREKKREKGTTLPLRQTRGKTKAKHLFSLHFPTKLKPQHTYTKPPLFFTHTMSSPSLSFFPPSSFNHESSL